MIFSMDGKIRYSEVDEDGKLTVGALVNYLQDSTMFHSESLGGGLKILKENNEGWFLYSWQIDIEKIPELYENITVHTNPYEFKGFFGGRNFRIENEAGEDMVVANSIWIFMDIATQTPKRVYSEISAIYEPLLPKLDMEYTSRKIKMPEKFDALEAVRVDYSQIDTNHHVNNSQYIVTAMKAAGLRQMPKRIRAEYKKAAVLDDVFYPYVNKDSDKYTVDLRNAEGESFATVTFEYNLEK